MSACVFCQRIKSYDYEDSAFGCVWFEPLNPVVEGHTLIVPKQHVEDARESGFITGATFAAAAEFVQPYARDFNLITSCGPAATQTIRHLHVHYVPRREGDGLHLPWTEQMRPDRERDK